MIAFFRLLTFARWLQYGSDLHCGDREFVAKVPVEQYRVSNYLNIFGGNRHGEANATFERIARYSSF